MVNALTQVYRVVQFRVVGHSIDRCIILAYSCILVQLLVRIHEGYNSCFVCVFVHQILLVDTHVNSKPGMAWI